MRHRAMSDRSSRRYTQVAPNWTLIATVFAWALAAWVPLPALSLLGALPLLFWLPGAAALRLSRSTLPRQIIADRPSQRVSAVSSGPPGQRSQMQVSDIAMSTALSAAIT